MNKLASVALGLSALMCLSGAAFAVNPAVPPAKPVAPKPVAPKPIAPKPNLGPRKPIAPTFDHARKRKAATNQQMWQAQQKANEALQTIDRLVSTGVFKVNDVPPKPPMIKPALPPKAAANNTARNNVPRIAQGRNQPAIAEPLQQYQTEWSGAATGIKPGAPNQKLSR